MILLFILFILFILFHVCIIMYAIVGHKWWILAIYVMIVVTAMKNVYDRNAILATTSAPLLDKIELIHEQILAQPRFQNVSSITRYTPMFAWWNRISASFTINTKITISIESSYTQKNARVYMSVAYNGGVIRITSPLDIVTHSTTTFPLLDNAMQLY